MANWPWSSTPAPPSKVKVVLLLEHEQVPPIQSPVLQHPLLSLLLQTPDCSQLLILHVVHIVPGQPHHGMMEGQPGYAGVDVCAQLDGAHEAHQTKSLILNPTLALNNSTLFSNFGMVMITGQDNCATTF